MMVSMTSTQPTENQHEHNLERLSAQERIDLGALYRSSCSCGWRGGLYHGRLDASLDYSDHVATAPFVAERALLGL